MEKSKICCDVKCGVRLECALFSLALDVNSGKKIGEYGIIPDGECHGNFYEKAKK